MWRLNICFSFIGAIDLGIIGPYTTRGILNCQLSWKFDNYQLIDFIFQHQTLIFLSLIAPTFSTPIPWPTRTCFSSTRSKRDGRAVQPSHIHFELSPAVDKKQIIPFPSDPPPTSFRPSSRRPAVLFAEKIKRRRAAGNRPGALEFPPSKKILLISVKTPTERIRRPFFID